MNTRCKSQWTLVAVAGLVASSTFIFLASQVKEINEPNPSAVNREKVARSVGTDRVWVDVAEVIYVNQDFSAFIFMGKGEAFSSFEISPDGDELLSEKEFRSAYPSRYGEVRRFTRGGRTLWGIVLSTTAGEWEQGRERYLENWRLAKERFKSRAKDHE